MGRHKTQRVALVLRLDPALAKEAQAEAERKKITRHALIVEALQNEIDAQKLLRAAALT
jgi:predicted transcriptional regulator